MENNLQLIATLTFFYFITQAMMTTVIGNYSVTFTHSFTLGLKGANKCGVMRMTNNAVYSVKKNQPTVNL